MSTNVRLCLILWIDTFVQSEVNGCQLDYDFLFIYLLYFLNMCVVILSKKKKKKVIIP